MATVIENLFVAIRADSKGLDSDLKGVLGKFKKLEDVGKNLSRKISLPILALSGIVLKMAGDFESAMNTVAAKSGATAEEFKKLEDLAKSLGATTRFSATQAAQGMAFLAQAGFDTNQILAALPSTLNLASAGNLELARAADIASNVLKGFRLPAEEAARAADVLAFSSAKTNTDVEELGAAMSRIAPVAVDLGFSMEDTAAAIGVMSDAGVKGFRAGTALRAIFVRLAAATGEGAEAMERLGISVRDIDGNFVGLADVIDQFAEAEKNAADKGQFFADKAKIFGQEMISSAGILIAKGAPAFRELTKEIDNSVGASQKMTDIMERGFVGATRVLISALESLAIAVADTGLLKLAEDLTRNAAEFVRGIATMDKAVLGFAATVAGIAAGVPLLMLAVGLIGPAFISGAAAVATSSVAIVKAVATLSLAIKTGLIGALTAGEIAFGALGIGVAAAVVVLGTLGAAFLLNGDNAVESLKDLRNYGSGVAEVFRRVKTSVAGAFAALGDAIADGLNPAFTAIRNLVKNVEVLEAIVIKIQAFILLVQAVPKAALGAFQKFGRDAALLQKVIEAVRQATFDAVVASGDLKIKFDALGDSAAGVGDKIELAGTKVKSFSQKVADSVQGFKDAAENARVSAAAWDIWADAQDKAEAASGRFNLALALMEVPLRLVTLKMTGLGIQVRQAIEDFKKAGLPVSALGTDLGFVADQAKRTQEGLSLIPLELAKLTPGQELLSRIMESLKAGKDEAGSFAEAMRLLAFDSNFAKLSLEDQARVVNELREQWKDYTGETEATRNAQEKLNAAINEVSGILADAVLGFVSLGEAMKNFALSVVRDILQSAFKSLLQDMILQDNAVKKLTKSWTDFLGIFGGGKGKTPGVPAGDVVTGGGAGGAGDAAGGIAAGPLGLITGIANLISSVVANLQLARIEGSLNAIELNTRQTTRALTGAPELLAQSAQAIGQEEIAGQPPIGTGTVQQPTKGFAIPLGLGSLSPVSRLFGKKEEEDSPKLAAGTGQQGLGVLQVLFEHSDFLQDIRGQLKFQTASLDTLKDLGSRAEGLLITIRDSLSGLGSVSFGDPVVPALLGQIKEAMTGTGELITEVRATVAAVRQQFIFDRDIVQVTRDRIERTVVDILKELKLISSRPPAQTSISEFAQASFRAQVTEGVLP